MTGARGVVWVVLGCTLWSLSAGVARADRLADVAAQLTPYKIQDARVFDAMGELDALTREAETPRKRDAARFMHTMAAVDLWLISELRREPVLRERLAQQLGVPEPELARWLVRVLEVFERSVYADVAADAKRAVERRLAVTPHNAAPPSGVREALALLVLTGDAFDQPVPMHALAQLSADPCAHATSCPPRMANLGLLGRRAALTLEHAHVAYQLLQQSRSADPLLAQLSGLIDAAFVQLLPFELRPDVRLAQGSPCTIGEACAVPDSVDVLVVVEADRVRVGLAPRLRLNAEGQVQQVPEQAPVWPETSSTRLPTSYPGYIRHISSVVALLEQFTGGKQEPRVGVAVAAEATSHEWARVVLSAREAGSHDPWLLGRSAEGDARVSPLRIVTAFGAPKLEPSDMDVFVLMRGHSVAGQGTRTTIDRVSSPDGGSEWNFGEVAERARAARPQSAQLRFLPNLPADTVLRTAVAVAQNERPVTVILP